MWVPISIINGTMSNLERIPYILQVHVMTARVCGALHRTLVVAGARSPSCPRDALEAMSACGSWHGRRTTPDRQRGWRAGARRRSAVRSMPRRVGAVAGPVSVVRRDFLGCCVSVLCGKVGDQTALVPPVVVVPVCRDGSSVTSDASGHYREQKSAC